MNRNLKFMPRNLTLDNIDEAISKYTRYIEKIPLSIQAEGLMPFLRKIKREKMKSGPYPNVSLLEASNRIMTDLTILYGVKGLLTNEVPELEFKKFKVEYGNENKNEHDIISSWRGQRLIGEAFNVAPSYFYTKKSSALSKLRRSAGKKDIILLMFNADAIKKSYHHKITDTEFHYQVNIIPALKK